MALTSLEAGQSFLLDQFWEFYSEVIRLKRAVTQQIRISTEEAEPGMPGLLPPRMIDAQAAMQSLQAVLERQAYQARRQGGEFGAGLYREAQYAMAALADETFLHALEREGRSIAHGALLEQRLFKSQVAGERFYETVDRVLAQRDKSYVELAAVYLLALHLGFRGKYRGGTDNGRIQAYLSQLFEFIFGRSADLALPNRRLMEQAYTHTLAERTARRLPPTRRWKRAILVIVLVQLAIGQLIWVSQTDDLGRAARQVIQTARALGL
jgi:type VI secretion system protein ImpK